MAEKDPGSPSAGVPPETSLPESSAADASPVKAKGGRKRTKTGCLTCRRRRIKCGEEKPVCKNCIKSRRECEGYGQRVIFRQPVGPIPHGGPLMPASSNAPGAMDTMFAPDHPAYPVFPEVAPGRRPSLLPGDPQSYAYEGAQGNWAQNYSSVDPSLAGSGSGFGSAQHADTPQPTTLQGIGEQAHAKGSLSKHMDQSFLPPEAARDGNALPAGGYAINQHPFRGSLVQGVEYDMQEQDNDFDVETEDEMDMQTSPTVVPARPKPWSLTVPADTSGHGPQSQATYISYDNLLATYRPSPFTSPLLEPEAAQVFAHFITSSGPATSVFERCPANQSLMGPSPSTAAGYQNLFSYILPSLALENQALMHAMLATSSFHLARMTGQAPTASYRHYHYALRRVRKAVGLPHRRRQVSTLAATLLLGYYEVLDAEHSKWSNHIVGGSRLVQEFDFAGMTKNVRRMKKRVKAEQAQLQSRGLWSDVPGANYGWGLTDDSFARAESGVEEGLVSVLMGRPVNFDDFPHIPDNIGDSQTNRILSEKDLYEFRIRCDLYWWYCKQDLYQSLVSGNQLLVPYSRWGKCPPRAGVGDLNAIYGTADHLVLLLARVAEFAAKDRKRKIKTIEANGGVWQPPGASSSDRRPSQQQKQPSQSAGEKNLSDKPTKGGASPPMYGMAPSGPVRLPDGFAQSPPGSSPQSHSESLENQQDLDSASADAESEWNDMVGACQELVNAFGPGFQALPSDAVAPIYTPFGPALQYRTHTIAIIWSSYYTLLILLQRVHPSMPPASMIAAGVAAPQTAEYAQLIGRIIGGIHNPSLTPRSVHAPPAIDINDVSPIFCGILAETQISAFYAGVQYTGTDERRWLIALLRDVERLTGGRSASAISWGCEMAWKKAHEAGSGPEYIPLQEPDYVERRYGVVTVDGMEKRWVTVPREETIRVGTKLLSI